MPKKLHLESSPVTHFLDKNPKSSLSDIARHLNISRQAVSNKLRDLIRLGEVEKIGNTKGAKFILSNDFITLGDNNGLTKQTQRNWYFHKIYSVAKLAEDSVYTQLEEETGITNNLPAQTAKKLQYTFTEMLNNAIDHSQSDKVEIIIIRDTQKILFWIIDHGIGVFKSIKNKFRLKSTADAVDLLLVGKATTAPKHHSGEGIYFTIKIADAFRINSFEKRLVVRDGQPTSSSEVSEQDKLNYIRGSLIRCRLNINSKINLERVFNDSSKEDFTFDTSIVPALRFADNGKLVSRSQAKRMIMGWEKFKYIKLDFENITTIGQGFIDEIFRVWQKQHPNITIEFTQASDMIKAFINRARKTT